MPLETRLQDPKRAISRIGGDSARTRAIGRIPQRTHPEGNAVVMRADFAFDQLQKPKRAAEVWVERALYNERRATRQTRLSLALVVDMTPSMR